MYTPNVEKNEKNSQNQVVDDMRCTQNWCRTAENSATYHTCSERQKNSSAPLETRKSTNAAAY